MPGFDCPECEREWEAAKASGRRAMLAELGHMDELDSEDVEAVLWANIYQTYLSHEGSRMELIGWPQMYSDIALVGDGVAARARDQIMRKAREGAKT